MTRSSLRAAVRVLASHADGLLVVVFLVSGLALGSNYARTTRQAGAQDLPGFNQRVFGAALMSACGYGGSTPRVPQVVSADTPADQQPLIEFLNLRREALSCGDVPPAVPMDGLDGMQRSAPYLIWLTSGAWRLMGSSWGSIDRVLGLMFGVTLALAFLASRVAMPRPVAAGLATLLLLSPMHLANIPDIRDYSKAPFFMATLLVVSWLVAAPRRTAAVIAASAGAGMMIGVGFGMRTDIAVNLLLVVAAVVAFLPGALRETWKVRLVAAAVCVSGFTVAAVPVLRTPDSGSNLWHWALLGYSHEWDHALEVRPGPYEPGHFYSDSYVATVVDAYWGRTTGEPSTVSVGVPQYAPASRGYYTRLLTTFPADALLRGWASTLQVLDLPFAASGAIPAGRVPEPVRRGIGIVNRVRALLAGLGPWLFVIVVLAVSRYSGRLAVAVFGLAVFLSAYPAIQFQLRHVFQLEFLSLWVLGMVVSAGYRRLASPQREWASSGPRQRPSAWRPVLFAVSIVTSVVAPIEALRAYQSGPATDLLDSYERAPLVPVTLNPEPAGRGLIRLVDAERGLSRPRASRSISSNMLVASVGTTSCAVRHVALTFRYAAADPGLDFSRTIDVKVPERGQHTKVFFPVYQNGTVTSGDGGLAFAGVEVAEAEAGCIEGLWRFRDPDSFPLLLASTLAPGWRERPLYQVLAQWESPAGADEEGSVTYADPIGLLGLADSADSRAPGPGVATGAEIEYQARNVRMDGGVKVSGVSDAPHSYLVSWQRRTFSPSGLVSAEGRLERGGLTIGIVDGTRWIAKVDIDTPGAFRALVQVPGPGHYQVVLANHLSNTSLRNEFSMARLEYLDGGRE